MAEGDLSGNDFQEALPRVQEEIEQLNIEVKGHLSDMRGEAKIKLEKNYEEVNCSQKVGGKLV